MKEFKTELDKLLIDNVYSSIDIFPLIKSYNDGNSEIKSSISRLISSYKADNLINIDDESYAALYWIPPTAIETPDREIFVTSTSKFEQLYKEQNKSPIQSIHIVTHGDNSPVAGHTLNMGDIVQSASKNLDLNAPQAEPGKKQEIKRSIIKKALTYIGDNIVKIIVGLIILYLAIKLGLKK